MRTTWGPEALGGNPRPIPPLPVGIVWGGPGRCWKGNLPGVRKSHPTEIPRPPLTGCLRMGRLQAGIPGESPKVAMQRPRCREIRERNRAGPKLVPQGETKPCACTSSRRAGSRCLPRFRIRVGVRPIDWDGGRNAEGLCICRCLPKRSAACHARRRDARRGGSHYSARRPPYRR